MNGLIGQNEACTAHLLLMPVSNVIIKSKHHVIFDKFDRNCVINIICDENGEVLADKGENNVITCTSPIGKL